jgi:hypothetical protein
MTISSPYLLSSGETGINPGIRDGSAMRMRCKEMQKSFVPVVQCDANFDSIFASHSHFALFRIFAVFCIYFAFLLPFSQLFGELTVKN